MITIAGCVFFVDIVAPRKRENTADAITQRPNFAFDYGTPGPQTEGATGLHPENELTTLEEDNILDHLNDLTPRERDTLDALGKEFYIKDYFRMLRIAKEEEDERVNQLKVTAVVSPLGFYRLSW